MKLTPRKVDAYDMRREKFQSRIAALSRALSGADTPLFQLQKMEDTPSKDSITLLMNDVINVYGVLDRTRWFLSAEAQFDEPVDEKELLQDLIDGPYCYADADRSAFQHAVDTGSFPIELSSIEKDGVGALLECLFFAELNNPFSIGTIGRICDLLDAMPPKIHYAREEILSSWILAEQLGKGFHTGEMPLEMLTLYNAQASRPRSLDCLSALGELYELLSGRPLASLVEPAERENCLAMMRQAPLDSYLDIAGCPAERIETAYSAGLITARLYSEHLAIERAAQMQAPEGANTERDAEEWHFVEEERAGQRKATGSFVEGFSGHDKYCRSFEAFSASILSGEVTIDTQRLMDSIRLVLDDHGISHYEDDSIFFPVYLLVAQAQARITR